MNNTNTITNQAVYDLINRQLAVWQQASDNFAALANVGVKEITVGGFPVKVQFNPARIVSSAAKVDPKTIKERKCFLCGANRPEIQEGLPFAGKKAEYSVLINPFPIFPKHLTVPDVSHVNQTIEGEWERFEDMLSLAETLDEFLFFYNGPKCGASAPDHHHFQATRNGLMPLENDVNREMDAMLKNPGNAREIAQDTVFDYMTAVQDAKLYHYRRFVRGVFVIRARTAKSSAKMFYRFLDTLPVPEGDSEPRFNLITYCRKGEYRTIIILRTTHRSHHYFSEGPDHLTMSPGCADMGGVFIVPVADEYDKVTPELMMEMLSEVSITDETESKILTRLLRQQPLLHVGVMSAEEICFEAVSYTHLTLPTILLV